MAIDERKLAYNQYDDLDEFSHKCIDYLINNNEYLWKLLKYTSPDCWKDSFSNLTKVEKAKLIYSGEDDESEFRVFLDDGQPDVWVQEVATIRIYPYAIIPENRSVGLIIMAMDVYAHYKINHLSNYKARIDVMTKEVIKTFNGSIIGGIGRLFLDRSILFEGGIRQTGQIPFKGKRLLFGNKEAL